MAYAKVRENHATCSEEKCRLMFRCACRCECERLLGVYEKVLTLEAGGPVGQPVASFTRLTCFSSSSGYDLLLQKDSALSAVRSRLSESMGRKVSVTRGEEGGGGVWRH